MTLILTYDLDLQSPASYDHDLLTSRSSRSMVSLFLRQSGNKQMDGRTDGPTEAIALLAALMRSIIIKISLLYKVIQTKTELAFR